MSALSLSSEDLYKSTSNLFSAIKPKRIKFKSRFIVFATAIYLILLFFQLKSNQNLDSKLDLLVVPDQIPQIKIQEQTTIPIKPPRIAYINRHPGTSTDLSHLSKLIGFNYSEFDPRNLNYGVSQTREKANEFHDLKLAEFFCSSFDVIIIGDVNLDARFLLEYINQDPIDGSARPDNRHRCELDKLIMQTTNRYDIFVYGDDRADYHETIRKIVKRNNSMLSWIYNNPWEKKYMEITLGGEYVPKSMHLIRPFGVSAQSIAARISVDDSKLPVFVDHPTTTRYYKELIKADINVKLLERRYGGPTVLKQYKCVIDIPYQTRYILLI